MYKYLLLLLVAYQLHAQSERPGSVSAGFKIGAPINEGEARNYLFGSYTQSRWTGGPTVELRLPYRFALEFDALYRTNRSSINYPYPFGGVNAYNYLASQRTTVWDFPLLLKYRFRLGPARPFLSAGYLWSRQSTNDSSLYVCPGPASSCRPPDPPDPGTFGGPFQYTTVRKSAIFGAGLEFKTRYVTISPEVRMHGAQPTNANGPQITGIVGFTFGNK